MAERKRVEAGLKTTICEFVDDLGIVFSGSSDLLLVKMFFESMNPESCAQHVVRHVLPHERHIVARNKSFFIDEKDTIFSGLPKNKIQTYSSILSKGPDEGGPSTENMEMIWRYFDVMISLAKRCRKNE